MIIHLIKIILEKILLHIEFINPGNSIPESEDGTIYINISPQNDAPISYLTIPDQTLLEDSNGNQLSLELFFIDIDNDTLEYDIFLTNDQKL